MRALIKAAHKNIVLPGSKSISNRALIMAALCKTPSVLHNLLESDDTKTCQRALEHLHTSKMIDCRDAGTVARFLVPVCAALGGTYHFDGSTRMRARPINELVRILKQQGVTFECLAMPESMPFIMTSKGLLGGEIFVDVSDSSQFLSGLLMAAPLTQQGMKVRSSVVLSAMPYVAMTVQLMQKFGVHHHLLDDYTIEVAPSIYHAATFSIEPDASTASYFFAAAALTKSAIKILDLNDQSIQGDVQFLALLEQMGCIVHKTNHYIEVIGPEVLQGVGVVNMSGFTDTFMTLAVMAPFLPTVTVIHGLRHTRLQESDRVAAMVEGLSRMGIKTENTQDTLTIFPGVPSGGMIDSYADHRIAMSFAIMGLKVPGVDIIGAACVSKSCPIFFQLLDVISRKGCHPGAMTAG